MPPKAFKCKQCGNCCLNLYDAFSTCATDEDIRMWDSNGRDDILEWVDPIHVGGVQYVYDIWISPVTGEDVNVIGYTKNQASEIVEILLELIKSSLESGDDVLISGFGKFCVKEKRQRRGRNPATGKDLILKPRKVVTFRCSGNLRKKINGHQGRGNP